MEYWNKGMETMPKDELRQQQFLRFKKIFTFAYENSKAHRALYEAHGISPDDLRSIEDISRVPLTNKAFLVGSLADRDNIYGSSLAVPERDVMFYHQTSGTTSAPVPQPDSMEDWYYHGECWANALWAHGVRPEDRVLIAFNYNLFIGFWQCHYGCEKLGAEIISAGGLSTEMKVRKIIELGVTVVATTPSYAFRMAEEAEKLGLDLKNSSVRILITSGEPGALIDGVKKRLGDAWGAGVFDNIGATEVGSWGFECEAHPGAMHINEANFYPEIIGIEDGLPITEPGKTGLLVLTNFFRKGRPCIRFNTNDLACWSKDDCSCGRSFRMIEGGIQGRADHILKVRGTFVNPAVVEDIITSHDKCSHSFQIVIHSDNKHIDVLAEAAEGLPESEYDSLAQEIGTLIHNATFVSMDVKILPFASLERSEGGKVKKIIDKRKESGIWKR